MVRNRTTLLACFVMTLFVLALSAHFTERQAIADQTQVYLDLDVKDVNVIEVLRTLSIKSGANIVATPTVSGKVTIRLTKVTVEQALEMILSPLGFKYEKSEANTYIVSKEEIAKPLVLAITPEIMTIKAQNVEMRQIVQAIADNGINIVLDGDGSKRVTIQLNQVATPAGLKVLCQANGFTLIRSDAIYRVIGNGAAATQQQVAAPDPGSTLPYSSLSVSDGKLTVKVKATPLNDIIRAIAERANINLLMFGNVQDTIDVQITDIPLEDGLRLILAGTRCFLKKEGDVYIIADSTLANSTSNDLVISKVIPLKYLKAEDVYNLLPATMPVSNIRALKEQNALAVVGTSNLISDVEAYLSKIDKVVPQVMVEALFVETNLDDSKELGLKLKDIGVSTDKVEGKEMNYNEQSDANAWDITVINKYKQMFNATLKALVEEKKAIIKANPRITTLNGKEATIKVATEKTYKLTQSSTSGNVTTDSATLKSISGGVTLRLVPWISDDGEVTMELHPEVSSLSQESSSSDSIPDISKRTVDTTIRVKDGETIRIGGLIQDQDAEVVTKIPILGDIPLIGNLFKTTKKTKGNSELIIFITPHIIKPGESVQEKIEATDILK